MRTEIDDDAFGKTAINAENSERGRAAGDEFRGKDNGDGPSLGYGVLRISAGSCSE